ncbi:MAG: ABC transporter ATP-binding protein [Candidatus Coproplasma sp.]
MSEIAVKNLSVVYKSKKREAVALDDFSATFKEGMNVIVGYSGCGKTTLLRCILGLVDYDDGGIFLDGQDLYDIATKDRNFSFVSQEYVLYPQYTVFENIAFPLKLLKAGREEITQRVKEMAEMLDLTACLNRKPKHISGGQQQRVAIARALIKRPSVCLMDEPFSNTDEVMRAQTVRWLKKAFDVTGCTCLYVTHDFKEALILADTIYVMNEGKLELCGTPDDVFNSDNQVVKILKEGSGL